MFSRKMDPMRERACVCVCVKQRGKKEIKGTTDRQFCVLHSTISNFTRHNRILTVSWLWYSINLHQSTYTCCCWLVQQLISIVFMTCSNCCYVHNYCCITFSVFCILYIHLIFFFIFIFIITALK